jgi:hypothetical protein
VQKASFDEGGRARAASLTQTMTGSRAFGGASGSGAGRKMSNHRQSSSPGSSVMLKGLPAKKPAVEFGLGFVPAV